MTVECTLKELYCGAVKQLSFCRSEIHHAPKKSELFTRQKQIEIKPGFSEQTVLVFRGEGNQGYNQKTSDLVVKVKQIEHPCIKRIGEDLVMTVPVSLAAAIDQAPVTFATLDGRSITVAVDQQISPQTCVQVANEGMPNSQGGRVTRGNLFLRFDIQFPAFTAETIDKLVATLRQNEQECNNE